LLKRHFLAFVLYRTNIFTVKLGFKTLLQQQECFSSLKMALDAQENWADLCLCTFESI
jgi:hypothetical protein